MDKDETGRCVHCKAKIALNCSMLAFKVAAQAFHLCRSTRTLLSPSRPVFRAKCQKSPTETVALASRSIFAVEHMKPSRTEKEHRTIVKRRRRISCAAPVSLLAPSQQPASCGELKVMK